MMDSMMGAGGWGMGFGWIFMVLFWALVILGIAAIAKWLMGASRRSQPSAPATAMEILEQRYARGEIGRDEFEQRKRDLQG